VSARAPRRTTTLSTWPSSASLAPARSTGAGSPITDRWRPRRWWRWAAPTRSRGGSRDTRVASGRPSPPATRFQAPGGRRGAVGLRETPPRLHELAEGLAYWAANFTRLPESDTAAGTARPSEAIATLALLPASERRSGGFITARLAGLQSFAPFKEVAGRVALNGDPSSFFSNLTETFARVYLENATPGKVITFVHAVTGPSAARLLLPYADAAGRLGLMRYAWQAAAAMYVAMGDRPREPLREADPLDAAALADRAVVNGDEHAIKLTEACLRESALHPRPVYRLAAQDALSRLGRG